MYCQYCGTKNDDGALVCSNCNKPLAGTQSQSFQAENVKPKKKKGKKVLLIITIVFAVFWVIGTFAENDKSPNSDPVTMTATKTTAAAKTEPTTGKIGDYVVTIKSAKIVKNTMDGKDDLVVTYSFTNNGKEAHEFIYSISDTLYQNGVEIQSLLTKFGVEDEYDFDNASKKIKPGSTLDVQRAYELSDTTSDVLVEITEWISFNNKKLEYVIKLNDIN